MRLIPVIGLLFMLSFAPQATAQDGFREATWGMMPEAVSEAIGCTMEKAKNVDRFGENVSSADFQACDDEVMEYPVRLVFRFGWDEITPLGLEAVRVKFLPKGKEWNLHAFRQSSDKTLAVLIEKYGQPINTSQVDVGLAVVGLLGGGGSSFQDLEVHIWSNAGIKMIHNPNGALSSLDIYYEQAKVGALESAKDEL